MANALARIVKEAKRIKRLHPNKHKKWTGYIKEASAKYRGHSPAPKKRVAKVVRVKKSRHRSVAHTPRPGKVNNMTTAQLTAALKSKVAARIDKAVILKFHAKKKSLKRKYQKLITAGKAQLRKYC